MLEKERREKKDVKDMELIQLIPSLVSRIQFLEEALEDQTGIYIPKRPT